MSVTFFNILYFLKSSLSKALAWANALDSFVLIGWLVKKKAVKERLVDRLMSDKEADYF